MENELSPPAGAGEEEEQEHGSSPPPSEKRLRRLNSELATFRPVEETAFNPTPQQQHSSQVEAGERLVLVMVGLPARGKTYIAKRVCQYLSFFHGRDCKVFNIGSYRRELVGAKTPASWFDSQNEHGIKKRMELAEICMRDMKQWMIEGEGRIGIYDATNTTRSRREWIVKQVSDLVQSRSQVLFIESVVNDEVLVEHNIREAKLSMPDYEGTSSEDALKDFRARIHAYSDVYEMMGSSHAEDELSWVRVEDGGRFVAMNRIRGCLQGRLCQLLSTLHTMTRPLYLSRHGQSQYNEMEKIGGDSLLSAQGEDYAKRLAEYVHEEILGLNADGSFPNRGDNRSTPKLRSRLYTSSLLRTKETTKHIQHPVCSDGWTVMRARAFRNLDEIFAGMFDGMTYEEIKALAPEEYEERSRNKLGYRYPRGESYLDVIERLEPVVMELERQRDPVLVVGHQGILRIIYCYFKGMNREEAPFVPIPLNTVIKLVPGTYTCEEERFLLVRDANQGQLNESFERAANPPSH